MGGGRSPPPWIDLYTDARKVSIAGSSSESSSWALCGLKGKALASKLPTPSSLSISLLLMMGLAAPSAFG